MSSRLAVGDPAPAFHLPAAGGAEISLSDYAGQRVIVYFYPAALTPGCTTQAIDFTAAAEELATAGVSVLGISPDPVDKLERFASQQAITFPLLADPSTETLRAYGAYGERMLYGKKIEGVLRSTFVVDLDSDGAGTIAVAQYNVRAAGHVARLRRELGV